MLSNGSNILGLRVDHRIGKGKFGNVYKVTEILERYMCCLKHVNLNFIKLFHIYIFFTHL